MTAEEFERLCMSCVNALREVTPYDTGNLRFNGVRFEFEDGGNTCKIYVDQSIAPYMPYTNEKWISPRWKGKTNPNEGWWQNKAVNAVQENIRRQLKADIVSEQQKGEERK